MNKRAQLELGHVVWISIMTLVVLFFVGLISLGLFVNDLGSSSGDHLVFITAVEHRQGLFFEDRLAWVKTDLTTTQEEVYCISNPQVKAQLQEAQWNKERVLIHYEHTSILWNSECNQGQSIITGVTTQ